MKTEPRYPKLTFEEIQKMIHYTPIEKTVVGQELIQMGMNEGILKKLEAELRIV